MKIFKHRNLMGCIYALLMAVPLFSVLGRTCYSIFNKNAYQSYSSQMVEQQINISNPNGLIEYQTYIVNYKEYETTNFDYIPYIYYYDINIDWSDYTSSDTTNVVAWRVRTNDNLLQLRNADNSTINLFNVFGNTLKTFTFTFKSLEFSSSTAFLNISIYGIYYTTDKLDNAFDYSLSKFVNDNDFGKLNFFQWFWDIFLTNNQQNNLYIHFVNWYMNYALCVSSAYILFLVLMWFINYSRRILERGMNYDW